MEIIVNNFRIQTRQVVRSLAELQAAAGLSEDALARIRAALGKRRAELVELHRHEIGGSTFLTEQVFQGFERDVESIARADGAAPTERLYLDGLVDPGRRHPSRVWRFPVGNLDGPVR